MYSEITANKTKTVLIMMLFFVVVSILAYFVSFVFLDNPSYTVYILIFAAGYALFSYFGAAKMAIAMNGAKEVDKKSEPRLYRIVENLAITTGMPMPKVYVIEDAAMNAFATGRDPKHAVVAATRGIMDRLDDSELQGVMAHELGHVKNYDIRVSMIAFALVTVVSLLSDVIMRSFFWGGNDDDNNSNPAGLLVGLILAIVAPLTATLLQLAISRRREYLADATGALTTRYPEGLASALRKISEGGSTLKRQNKATAHLFFANPLKPGSVAKLFSTHPPVEDRINRLMEMSDNL